MAGPARPPPHQTNAAGRDAKPGLRPGHADGVIDLNPLDDHVGVTRVADADAPDETVQLQSLHINIGLDAGGMAGPAADL